MSPTQVKKIVVVGDQSVGKTSFVKMVRKREFSEKHEPTNGCDVVNYEVNDTNMEIWDCGGLHVGMRDGYWIGAKVAIAMFAVNSLESWKNVSQYIKGLTDIVPDIPIVLVGSKVDIIDVKVDKGRVARGLFALRRRYPKLKYMECSPRIGYGCDEVMDAVAELCA